MSSRSLSAYDKGNFFAIRFEDIYLPFCRMKKASDIFCTIFYFYCANTDKLSNSIVSPSASLSSPVPPATPGSMRVISRADDEDAQDPDEDGGLHSHFVEGPAKYYIGMLRVHFLCFLFDFK